MKLEALLKDWHPEDVKIFREYCISQGIPRHRWYRLISRELETIDIKSAATFARFIGCPLEDLAELVTLEIDIDTDHPNKVFFTLSNKVRYSGSQIGICEGEVFSLRPDFTITRIWASQQPNLTPATV